MSEAPLSILQILTHYRINSGGAVQAFLLSRELARLGHRVTVAFAERDNGTNQANLRAVQEIGCHYTGLRLRRFSSIAGIRRLLRQGFDVVHLHRELALHRFLQAARLSPPVGAVANVGTSKIPNPARARRLRSSRIDRIVVVAEALKRLLVCTTRVDPTKIDVVHGAFDETRFHDDVEPYDRQKEFGLPAGARLIGMIANMDPKKGHRVFVEAARETLAQRDDVWFICAGKGNQSTLDGFADEFGVPRERLLFVGFSDSVERLLRTLDVSVCASTKGEGMTGTIRESMASGVPVISTALAGNMEIVRQRETGLLIPPGDASALARAIIEILDDHEGAKQRAERAAAMVRESLGARRRAGRMEAIYQDIVSYRQVRSMTPRSILYPEIQG